MELSWRQKLCRVCVKCLSVLFYRVRVFDHENVPKTGGALLVPNHLSWIDGFLIMMCTRRGVRPIVYAGNFQSNRMKRFANTWKAILVSGGPKSIVRALQQAQEAIQDGDLVCIFAEGGISRNGQVQTFRPGLMKIIADTGLPVVPVYIDEVWGSIFSFERARFFFKWPRRWRQPVSIHYGKPMTNVKQAAEVRQAVLELGTRAQARRKKPHKHLVKSMIRMCRKRMFQPKIQDSGSGPLTGGMVLLRSLILRRLLRRNVLAFDEKHVGVLLPPSNGGVLVNLALALDRRVSANLNYTVSSEVMNACIREAGIRHVLTSRQVLSKLNLEIDAEVVELENLKDKVTVWDKIAAALGAFVLPSFLTAWILRLGKIKGDDEATIIFTSGSTGTPKGVVLTHDNIASNVEAIEQVVHLNRDDCVVGILPFFHSFGYTVTLWTPATTNIRAVYHYSPLDAKRIGILCKKYAATILLTTPTFLRSYIKRCKPEQFKTVDVVVTGAEKLPTSLSDTFEEKFGVRPVEGYGCTELSPLVSVNVPVSRSHAKGQIDSKEGTVGRTIPLVAAKTVHLDSGETLPVGEQGMLWIKGPNVMKGYLNQPDLTAEVVRDGWYRTGDIAFVDTDGFIHITGRQSRFSKIGGEMIPHIKIEETLAELIGGNDDEEEGVRVVVTAVPDEKKGERLVVLHTPIAHSVESLRDGLSQAGLPNLFIPTADAFFEIDTMPVLGTGKIDLQGIKEKAAELTTG